MRISSETFTTPLSPQEVLGTIRTTLNTKSKFLFVAYQEYYGFINTNDFTVGRTKGDKYDLLFPKVKGSIISDHPTTVLIWVTVPRLLALLFFTLSLIILALFFFTEDVKINGIPRNLSAAERFFFAVFFLVVLITLFYLNVLWPAVRIKKDLKRKMTSALPKTNMAFNGN